MAASAVARIVIRTFPRLRSCDNVSGTFTRAERSTSRARREQAAASATATFDRTWSIESLPGLCAGFSHACDLRRAGGGFPWERANVFFRASGPLQGFACLATLPPPRPQHFADLGGDLRH